jgi:S-DNA-T family DNA segregation ATPase FtsK/SpoIIIE
MAKKKAKKNKSKFRALFELDTPPMTGGILLLSAFIMQLSLISFASGQEARNALGTLGYSLGWMLTAIFGLSGYIFCAYIGWLGWRLLFNKSINHAALKHFFVGVMILSLSMLLTLIEEQFTGLKQAIGHIFFKGLWERKLYFHLGGAPMYYIYRDLPLFNLQYTFNTIGVGIISTFTLVTSILFLTKTSPRRIPEFFISLYRYIKDFVWNKEMTPLVATGEDQRFVKLRTPSQPNLEQEMMAINPDRNLIARPSISRKEKEEEHISKPFEGIKGAQRKFEITARPPANPIIQTTSIVPSTPMIEKEKDPKQKREAAINAQKVYNGDYSKYKLPPTSLLTDPVKVDQSSLKKDLRRQAEVLEETLHSFGIEAKVGQINCGPTITSFEVHPAIGVKVQKIKTLENDIALNMEAKSIRILAPIPGKAAIGIEVPNPQPQEVSFKEMLNAYKQSGNKCFIPLLLGKTVSGEHLMNDLAKMPHCIIAGATGSGKSVCINSIVMSILMTAKPDEIKLIMVDPKKVELTPYTKLPHMLSPVITEPSGACAALAWLVKEMENRYEVLKHVGVRNISSFNERTINKSAEEALSIEIPEKMHYIVCIIDELADLMMVSNNSIETHIARIAQMARAVGIHLILATQRPSREVITGLIKANFPTRISFKVASRVNSQIVLDEIGAESLLGNGDMLFLPPSSSHLLRAQGAFVRDGDINAVVAHICEQAPPNYMIKSFEDLHEFDPTQAKKINDEPADVLYDQALETIISTGNASTTFLQRKLKVGYARAASIIDQLEANGIVGPADGAKPRKILVGRNSEEETEEF